MKDISIRAFGSIPVGEHWKKSLVQLGVEAIQETIKNLTIKIDALYVGNMLGQSLNQQDNLASLIADHSGLDALETLDINSGENSGLMALRMGALAIASGEHKNVLVLGVEKTSDRIQPQILSAHSSGLNHDYETSIGATQTSHSALLMQRYLYETGAERDVFEILPLNGHQNAVNNQNAMYRKPLRKGLYSKMGIVAEPLNLFDIAPYADGAACVLLTSEDSDTSIKIKSIVQGNDNFTLSDREKLLELKAVETSTKIALKKAGLKLEDIHFCEVDDFTSIQTLLSLEAIGFAPYGEGWILLKDERINKDDIAICTMGGSKARGYPIAATGLYQIIEAIHQLKGDAGEAQVANPKFGLVQAISGVGISAITCILSND